MFRTALLALSAPVLLSVPALADTFTATQTVERMVTTETPEGIVKTELSPAETVIPGDTLVYSLTYANGTDEPASNVVLTMPVPAEVTYVDASAASEVASVAFSADGGATFQPRDEVMVAAETGARAAQAEDITHIRWTFAEAVPAGASGTLGYKAILK